jgi:hypothetical protein
MATGISMTQIRLVWTDNSNNEDGFLIERCDKKNCRSVIQVGQVEADVKEFVDFGLSAATQYTYRMRAYNTAGFSAYSNKSTGKTLRR